MPRWWWANDTLPDDAVSALKDAVAQFKRGFELGDGTLLRGVE